MSFCGAIVAQPSHTFLRARVFSYVSAGGLGFGGAVGAGCEPERTAGQSKNRNEEDEDAKTKCHWSNCHLGTRENFNCRCVSVETIVSHNFEGQNG
jgi:hypothetical protein